MLQYGTMQHNFKKIYVFTQPQTLDKVYLCFANNGRWLYAQFEEVPPATAAILIMSVYNEKLGTLFRM